ncbi:MAG: LysR family transcriptional regulator [Acinetobacter venetianus]|uniref:LysR family transcriptional regulator n=1 Tax=Acinetobacter venetianus TaxID=52133 RepID=UPI003C792898
MMNKKYATNRFSLNLLRTFAVTARLNSFKRAAEELFITPSAVSQQIKELENFLGTPLFDRHSQGISLNKTGELFWVEINPSLQAIIKTTESLHAQFNFSQLRITSIPAVANRIIFPNLNQFQFIHPNIQLFIESSEKNIDILKSSFDLAIRFGEPPWPECEYEKLIDINVQAIFNSDVEREFSLLSKMNNIVKAPLIYVNNYPRAWESFFANFELTRSEKFKHIFVNDYQSSMEAVLSSGVAIALFPLEKGYVSKHGLLAPSQLSFPYGAVYAVTKQGNLNEPYIQLFLSWLKVQLQILSVNSGVKLSHLAAK